MPSNKDLTESILAIDPNAQLEGMKNADLEALLKTLKADAPAAGEAKADAPAAGEAKADAPAAGDTGAATRIYKVVAGKAITSKKGTLGPGDEVRPEYFPNGQESIDNLIERGLVE